MQFSVTLQLNSTFDDLGTLADFSAKLRDLLASFGGSPAKPAPVAIRQPEPVATTEVAFAAPAAPESVPAPKKSPGRPRKTEDASPALPLETPAAAPQKPEEAVSIAEAVSTFSPVAEPASAPAAAVAAPVQTSAPATGPARTIADCKDLVLKNVPKLGKDMPPRLMKVLQSFGVTALANLPADRAGDAYVQLEAAFAA